MKIEVKKVDAVKRELKFEIPKDRVSQKLEEVYTDLGKIVKIKGFRQGKVPRNLLESQHGGHAREEAIKQLIPEAYREGIAREKISPLDLPEIEDVHFKDGIITFTAKVDIKPDVEIKSYKKIKVKRKNTQVTDEEVIKTIEYFQKSQGQEGKPLDDAFARGLGYPNLEEFKKFLSRQIEMDKDRHSRVEVENQIVEHLLKESKLALPQAFLQKQLEYRLQEAKERLKSQGMPDAEIEKKEEELRKQLPASVERDVKTYLIFDKIAQQEGITVKEGENLPVKVLEFLMKEAEWEV